jgi:hypothetical protein
MYAHISAAEGEDGSNELERRENHAALILWGCLDGDYWAESGIELARKYEQVYFY